MKKNNVILYKKNALNRSPQIAQYCVVGNLNPLKLDSAVSKILKRAL